MIQEVIPVTCAGQFFYIENRQKNFRSYEVEVQLPAEEVDRALWFVKKNLIDEAVQAAYPDHGFVGIRTCEIITELAVPVAGGDVVESMDEVEEDMFDNVDVVGSEDFDDVEDVVNEG